MDVNFVDLSHLLALFVLTLVIVVFRSSARRGRKAKAAPVVAASNDLLKVWVQKIIDGDTIIVRNGKMDLRIRLDAIDCPEDGQSGGGAAHNGLSKFIHRRHVYLETHGLDIYGRTLATIYVMDGTELINVNEKMVACGHAWVMRKYYMHLSGSRKMRLNHAQDWAKSKKVGLWKDDNPIPPWEWRRKISA